MPRNPREPKNVNKLIAKHREHQVESALVAWLKKVAKRDEAVRQQRRGGGGTRRQPRQ